MLFSWVSILASIVKSSRCLCHWFYLYLLLWSNRAYRTCSSFHWCFTCVIFGPDFTTWCWNGRGGWMHLLFFALKIKKNRAVKWSSKYHHHIFIRSILLSYTVCCDCCECQDECSSWLPSSVELIINLKKYAKVHKLYCGWCLNGRNTTFKLAHWDGRSE